VKIYICDTNNHCIRVCHYDVGSVDTLVFTGVPKSSVEFHEKNATVELSAKKRETLKFEGDTNLRCEGDQCFPVS